MEYKPENLLEKYHITHPASTELTSPERTEIRVHYFKSWKDFYKANAELKTNPKAAIMIQGGINSQDVVVEGIIAVHGGINEGNITASYIMFGGGINRGTVWAKERFWRGGGIFPNVFVGQERKPFDESTHESPNLEKKFNEVFKYYQSNIQ